MRERRVVIVGVGFWVLGEERVFGRVIWELIRFNLIFSKCEGMFGVRGSY